jgi:hypothetical protein
MSDPDDFWSNRFHACALAAGFIATSEGRLADRRYVQSLCYDLFEGGAFRAPSDGPASDELTNVGPRTPAVRKAG